MTKSPTDLSKFRRSLGVKGVGLSDDEIMKIYEFQDRLADIVFDNWLRKRNNIVNNAKN